MTALDDLVVEGGHTGAVTHTASSADPAYNGVVVADVVAGIADNDSVGVEGDLNGDGRVGLPDLVIMQQHFGTTSGASPADGDLDGDGDVDRADLSRLVANYGRTTATPPQAVVAAQSEIALIRRPPRSRAPHGNSTHRARSGGRFRPDPNATGAFRSRT